MISNSRHLHHLFTKLFCIMRQLLTLVVTLFISLIANADTYQVTANVLNLRTSPSKNAPVGTTAVKGENLNVIEINGEWATIDKNGKTFYGAAEYMIPADTDGDSKNATINANRYAANMLGISIPDKWKHHSDLPLYITLGLLACLLFIRIFGGSEVYEDHSNLFVVACLIFICACGLEMYHFLFYDGNPTWFCSMERDPSHFRNLSQYGLVAGLGIIAAGFLIYGFCCFIQIWAFMKLASTFNYYGNRYCNNKIGYLLTILSMIAYIIAVLLFPENSSAVLAIDILVMVGWFVWLAMCNSQNDGSWVNLITMIAFWIIGSIGTLVMFLHFAVMLFVVVAVIFLLWICFGGGAGAGAAAGGFMSLFEGSSNETIARDRNDTGKLRDSNGDVVDVMFSNNGNTATATDFSGRSFTKKLDGSFEENR